MDKAEIVFEKIAGPKMEAFKSFFKGLAGLGKTERQKSLQYLADSVKGGKPYEGVIKMTTPKINKVEKMYGSQVLKEKQYTAMTNTFGKPGVAKPWTAEDKAKALAMEKYKRNLGLS